MRLLFHQSCENSKACPDGLPPPSLFVEISVKTGKYRSGDEEKGEGVDGVRENFAEWVEHLLGKE